MLKKGSTPPNIIDLILSNAELRVVDLLSHSIVGGTISANSGLRIEQQLQLMVELALLICFKTLRSL